MKTKVLYPAVMLLLCSFFIIVSCSKEIPPFKLHPPADTTVHTSPTPPAPAPPPATPPPPPAVDPNSIVEIQPAIQVGITENVDNNIGGFYRALPVRYDSTTKKYPLLIVLHGVGELGNGASDLPRILDNGITKRLNQHTLPPNFQVNGNNFSFIIVSPQFKVWPQPADVNAMIDYAVAHYRVDASRIYVSGLSMGGGATWDYAISNPTRIAAIVPICGATWPTQAQCGNMASANLPVWAFHNDDDGTVGSGTTKMIVGFINSFNPNPLAQMTIWPSGGHDAWTRATDPNTKECNGKNMYEWMLQYKR